MKNFIAVFFSSLLGVVISLVLVGLIFTLAITSVLRQAMSGGEGVAPEIKPNSVLFLDLSSEVNERSSNNPLESFDFSGGEKQSLDIILMNLKKAKTDDNIKGIYLKLGGGMDGGFATIEEIRNSLLDFRKTGKFVVSYAEQYSQKAYYLASCADEVFMNPQGGMDWKGLSAQIMFFKNALEKMDVEIQVFRHGKFKSAVEPFFLDKMSASNREQTETFLNSIWNTMSAGVSKTRGISVEELNAIADGLGLRNAQDAMNKKFVDGLKYEDEVQSFLKQKLNCKEGDKIAMVKMSSYRKATKKSMKENEPDSKVAVIYAVGEIESGEGDDNTIGSDRIAKAIRDARLDSSIKAIVLRVNSPGGSALASDIMWREVTLARKAKPFIVSMGDVAASGGYYISCGADRIFAHPNTITGSIGVFGIMPNAQKLLSEKLGITIDTVNTNRHADLGTMFRPVSPDESDFMQQGVEDVYQVFISRVSDGRKISVANVDSIGQGRVWSGSDAVGIKLVDELGGLEKAISYAASKASLKADEYTLIALPKKVNPIEKFFSEAGSDLESRMIKEKFGRHAQLLKSLNYLMNAKGTQARLPFDAVVY
jgi:protease IV